MQFIRSTFIGLKKEKHNSLNSSYLLPNGDCILNPYCNLEAYDSKLLM